MPPEPSLRERLESASPAALALLPLRFFFGITFVYAGFDKLLDPAFFDVSNPASIASQLQAFTHVSPLAPLIRPMEPFAVPIGLLIAIAEIAIGLGALTGLAFRLAALGGAALSILFWLTASWTTHPYYYGADLPYAFGWIALTIGGTGDLLVPRVIRELGNEPEDEWDAARRAGFRGDRQPRIAYEAPEASPERRLILQAGVLAVGAFAIASLAAPLRFLRGGRSTGQGDDAAAAGNGIAAGDGSTGVNGIAADNGASAGGTGAGAADPTAAAGGATAAPDATAAAGGAANGLAIATIASVDAKGAVRIRVPASAPSSLPAGDPGILVKLPSGKYVCYDAVCTHQGCRVGWDAQDNVMLCPCHGAAFDPADHGAVLGGPTNTPLPELPIVVDKASGKIYLKA